MNDKWSKQDIFRTLSRSLGHVAFLTLYSSEYGPISQRSLSWGLDSEGFMLKFFWYLVFERKSKKCWHIKTFLNVKTTLCVHDDNKTSNSFYYKTLFYKKKLNGKKSVEIHQEVKEPKEPWVYASVTKRSLGATSTIFREGNRPGVIWSGKIRPVEYAMGK